MMLDRQSRDLSILEASRPRQMLSPDQLAALLLLSIRTLERMRREGLGPRFAKVGKKILYREADVEAWLDERSFRSTAEAKRAPR